MQREPGLRFLSFTNGTLIDDSFADEIREVGNFYPAFSIEGYEEENDFRRGAGTFQKCTAAMKRLKDRGVPFGASLCYTSKNTDVLASDEYMDWLIDQGVKFAWFFTYMPTGNGAVTDLMVSPEQRALMYKKMHGVAPHQAHFCAGLLERRRVCAGLYCRRPPLFPH